MISRSTTCCCCCCCLFHRSICQSEAHQACFSILHPFIALISSDSFPIDSPFLHSPIHSFIHSFIHSSIHSSTLLFIQSFQCNKSTAAFKSSRAAHHLGIRRGPICSDHISVSPVTSTFTIAQVDLHPGDNSAITTFESKLFHSYKIGAGKLGC